MPKLPKNAPKSAKKRRVKAEMDKWKAGKLHSGSKTGPIVKNQDQAIAIALSESGQGRQSARGRTRKKAKKAR